MPGANGQCYRSYHGLLHDHLVLTIVTDSEGKVIDSSISVVPEFGAEQLLEIVNGVIEDGNLDPTASIDVAVGDMRVPFNQAADHLIALSHAESLCLSAEAGVLQ